MVEAHLGGIKVLSFASSGLDNQGAHIHRQISQHTMGRFIFIVWSVRMDPEAMVEQLDDLVVGLVERASIPSQ